MNDVERTYLNLSLTKLREVLPEDPEELMKRYEENESRWSIETAGGFVFCLFSFPVLEAMEEIILLVYDEAQRIIADTAAYHTGAKAFLEQTEIYDWLSEESDWMYLEHYVLSNTLFRDYPYPFCQENRPADEEGQVLLYTNAYVTKAYRRRGIFRNMLEVMKDQVLRTGSGIAALCSVISMDPDVACYGPDSKEEPYYYSFEQDEPVRLQNAEIAEHVGFVPLRLEPDDPEAETDGTKLWFAVQKEVIEILDEAIA